MVHNFTVDALHTSTVTELCVVVHNTKKCLSIPEFRTKLEDIAIEVSRNSPSNNKRPNTVALFETADGEMYIGYSSSRVSGQNRMVIKDKLGNQLEHVHNYGCAEIDCFFQALEKNEKIGSLRGGKIGAVKIRGDLHNPVITDMPPCSGSGGSIGCVNLVTSLGLTIVKY